MIKVLLPHNTDVCHYTDGIYLNVVSFTNDDVQNYYPVYCRFKILRYLSHDHETVFNYKETI